MSSQVMARKYKVGDDIEVWSNSHERWSKGTIEKVEPGKVHAKYYSPDGAAMIKQMPETHEHLRHYEAPAPARAASKQAAPAAPTGVYKAGENIEIWSQSQNAWCRGHILKLEGDLVNVKYTSPDGQTMTKLMPNGHEYLRHEERQQQQAMPPPPPPPGRGSRESSHHMDSMMPLPTAESAVQREDSAEIMGSLQEAGAGSGATSQAASIAIAHDSYSSAVATSMNQGMNGTHHCAPPNAPNLKTKGYRAANSNSNPKQGNSPNQCEVMPKETDVFVAESTSWVPSGSMALCGMPIKANKKQEVALNDDGTPVARCVDIDRCCRCSMPVGSYFEHTCPRCVGIVCLACLDDVKYIIGSYRCPCCGDQTFNQEALKQTLWYLNGYRTAQRTVTAVPILVAGLFGFGPEGAKPNRNQTSFAEVEEPVSSQQQGPPAATPKLKVAAKGPPPAPPRPKAGAKPSRSGGTDQEPQYHTRPPANWAEGAGNYKPGQAAAGGSKDPATVANAMHQAATKEDASRSGPIDGHAPASKRGSSTDSRAQAQNQQQQQQQQVQQGTNSRSGGGAGLQAPNIFASVNAPMAPQRGANPFASATGGHSPFSTRVPPDQLQASPMR